MMITKSTTNLLLIAILASALADFGDYADLSFQCPSLTTCPTICSADLTDCPTSCPLNATYLCPDGSCQPDASQCDPRSTNFCADNACGYPLACPKIILEYTSCFEEFDLFYERAASCPASSAPAPEISWTLPGFVIFYIWIGVVTAAVLGWCAYNQRFRPVGKARPLHSVPGGGRRKSSYPVFDPAAQAAALRVSRKNQIREGDDNADGTSIDGWSQTAYCRSKVGTTIYGLVIITLFGFHGLLATTCAFWYAQQDGYDPSDINPFPNDQQVLIAFECVWLIGFFWSLAFKWPASIRALFLRRCEIDEATHVAVFCPSPPTRSIKSKNKCVVFFARLLDRLTLATNVVMGALFGERQDLHGTKTFCVVEESTFIYQMRRFNYDKAARCFVPGSFVVGHTLQDLLCCKDGLSEEEVAIRHSKVGKNAIHLAEPSFLLTMMDEFNKIFYLYQMYMVWTWLNFGYWPMGIANLGIFVAGGLGVSYVRWGNEKQLYSIAAISGSVHVKRNGSDQLESISQSEIAPGDIIAVVPGPVYCDMVLIGGSSSSVLVDESALTGEATPTGKASIDKSDASQLYDAREHKKSTLAAGTSILEVGNDNTFAVAIKTGSNTSKGELLRDIFFRRGSLFKLNVEMSITLAILVIMAIANSLVVTRGTLGGAPFAYSFFFAAYVVYATIPVLLPTVFVASAGISLERLHKKRVICSDSDALMLAGKVKRAYWDKTGTLTKQGLEFLQSDCYVEGQRVKESRTEVMQKAMATCHTLTKSKSGDYIGHFVDRKMFLASSSDMMIGKDGEILIQSKDNEIVQVLVRHEFDHHRMSQSVIIRGANKKDEVLVVVKGSPEAMKKRCLAETLPSNFDDIVRSRSKQGEYQIAFGVKQLQSADVNAISAINRDETESGLTFVGFLGFKNLIREETFNVIKQLKEGDVKSVIVTGDSTYTGIKIAVESGIIGEKARVIVGQSVGMDGSIEWLDGESDEKVSLPSDYELEMGSHVLAINGDVWEHMLHSKLTSTSFEKYVAVFGRCSPNDKVSIVDYAVRQGTITSFCGDGGNDCGALKTASIGVALSDAEASIVSPFTSLDKSPRDVVVILREGRCCLANSFASYKFMIIYGQIKVYMNFAVTAFSVNFGLWNWFFLDGVWLVTLAFSLPLSRAARSLAAERPTSSLLGVYTMTSALGVLSIHVIFAVGALLMLTGQDWYECRKWDSTDVSNVRVIGDNYESEVIWLVSGYQYISTAFAYNLGYHFRLAWYRNYVLMLFIVAWTGIHFYIILNPSELSCLWRINCNNEDVVRGVFEPAPVPIQNAFNTTEMPAKFRVALLGVIIANTAAVIGWEGLIINTLIRGKSKRRKEKAKQQALERVQPQDESV